jgi:hypothetical protein
MAESDDLRAFIREIMARFDRKTAAWERRMDQTAAETAALDRQRHAEVMAGFAADRERLDDVIAENRAQRDALFKILDRLDGRGGPAAA